MKKIKTALKIIEISSLSLSIAFQQTIIKWLEGRGFGNTDRTIVFLMSVFFILLIFLIIDFLISKIIEVSFIRKIILGKDYIEGQWAELASDPTTNEGISYSLLIIKGDRDSILLNGDSFDIKTNKHIGSFVAESITYEYPNLYYSYKYDVNNNLNVKEGISRIKFISRPQKEPIMLTGFFIDIDNSKKTNFTCWKIQDKKMIREMSNSENLKKGLLNFINKMDSNG